MRGHTARRRTGKRRREGMMEGKEERERGSVSLVCWNSAVELK